MAKAVERVFSGSFAADRSRSRWFAAAACAAPSSHYLRGRRGKAARIPERQTARSKQGEAFKGFQEAFRTRPTI